MCRTSSIILSEEKGLQVSRCKSCKKFMLIHKSTHTSLSMKELSSFVNGLRNLGEGACNHAAYQRSQKHV